MNVTKPIDLVDAIIDEVALEGLDGITLEALWQRIAMRLAEPLPLTEAFMEQIWGLCTEILGFSYFELENPRDKLVIFDRYELEYLNSDAEKECSQKDIYPYYPVEDAKLGIRGSCANYLTRKNVDSLVKSLSLLEVNHKYGQKLVIVASQKLRERALISEDANPMLQMPLNHYCLLERIGRARKIGEITINKSTMKEDAKTLFYIRKGLLENGLIRKQVYYQGNTGGTYTGQNMGTLIHLTRFFNTRKPKVIEWAERLINYLKSKENYAAEYNEVKTELNLDYSIKKFFKIHLLQKIFRTDVKVPYRSYYPNSTDKEWQCKSNAKEKIVKLVTLTNPNMEISDLWRTEEVQEDFDCSEADIQNQKLNVPYLKQAYCIIESEGDKGLSQSELSSHMGLTKLISRTLVRNLVKSRIVYTYLDDIGRQRTTKFVSKKYNDKNSFKKQMEKEISKIKEYSQSIQKGAQANKSNTKVNKQERIQNNTENKVEESTIIATETLTEEFKNPCKEDSTNDSQLLLLDIINQILRKYKLFKNKKRFRYTSIKKLAAIKKQTNKNVHNQNIKNETCNGRESDTLTESDFYKTIECKLIVQKPECKKKSKNVAVVGIMENVHNSEISSNISYRLLHRANMVIESVKQHKVIEDTVKLMKHINAEEAKEGFDAKIDKNSLMRILQKLAEDNLIKNIKLILKNTKQTQQKVINFICDPSVEVDDPLIESAVEQAKLKFCLSYTQDTTNNTEKNEVIQTYTTAFKERYVRALGTHGIHRNNRIARKYGFCPKFVRMKLLHIFTHYLVYDNPGCFVPKSVFLENLKEDQIDDGSLSEFSHLYSKEVDWKMFIPPLPKYKGYPSGWALVSDIHLRMPLSLFVKMVNVSFEIPGLQELLDHPIKRHYLMKDVPTLTRNLLFFKRKYIFSIHEILTRLSYLGLLQFGQQKLKEKDQVFVYLNRHTELLDTTSSAAGYHRVENKPYPVTKFTFSSIDSVEKYWYEMWNTCINTPLGGRLVVEGKDILLEELTRKTEMIEALRVRAPEEAPNYDTGFVPGDRKGAAGIDSAFFAHLKRNWNWITGTSCKDLMNSRLGSEQSKPTLSIKTPKAIQTKKRSGQLSRPPPKAVSGTVKSGTPGPNKSRARKDSKTTPATGSTPVAKTKKVGRLITPVVSIAKYTKPARVIRKVLPRKPKRRRVQYDEIDFSALQRMDKLRVDWEQHEDNILLVCKVAMVYLCPNPRRNLISFSAIRDVLRSYSFTSFNKTSKACQRRLLYMLKQSKTINSVLLGVEEIKQDFYVNKRYGSMLDKIRSECNNLAEYEQRVEKIFKDLVTYIARKYYNISNMEHREPMPLPNTVQEFNLYYELKLPNQPVKSPGVSKEVREVNDIHISTINSVIHSSMCCGKERRSWAYQLFKVYQQYPEHLLRNAMLKIRADKMVIMKKNYMCAYKKFGNCMPMSSSQYQLSCSYYYKFQTRWPYQLFTESYNILLALFENHAEGRLDGIEVKPDDGGIIAALHDFIATDGLNIDIEIPEQVIMLDPGLTQKHEAYQRIAIRYQAILEALGLKSNAVKSITNDSLLAEDAASINDINGCTTNETITITDEIIEIPSRKRPREDDDCFEEVKQRKLEDDEEQAIADVQIVENESPMIEDDNRIEIVDNNKMDATETNSISNETQTMSNESSNNSQNDKQIAPVNIPAGINLQIFSCNWLDGFNNLETENTSASSSTKETGSCDTIKPRSIRASDLVQRAHDGWPNTSGIAEQRPTGDGPDARTRQTRIAMLQMREELQDLTFQDNQHAHEYFVVNSSKLLYSLPQIDGPDDDTALHQGLELPKRLLPLDLDLANELLDGLKRHAVFPKETPSLEKIAKDVPRDWHIVENVCKFIKRKAEFGATLHELVEKFDYLKDRLADILVLLVEKRLVLRAGIVAVRYIHHRYINPWIIHSYKILRLEKESHQIVPEGSVYVLDGDEGESKREQETNRIFNAANLFYDPPIKSINNTGFKKKINTDTEVNKSKDLSVEINENVFCKSKNEDQNDGPEIKKRKTEPATDIQQNIDIGTNESIPQGTKTIHEDKSEESKETTDSVTNDQVDVDTSEKSAFEIKKSATKASIEEAKENNDNASEKAEGQRKLRRKRTVFLKHKDVYRAAKLLDFNTAEEIKVVIKPWIRIDGVLNRRVLDRMLGSVLCYCTEKPGLSLTAVQNRFAPAIQPYHTRELIEILVKLGCLKTNVQRAPKVTLFSKPQKIDRSGNPDLVADSDCYIIEPASQYALKFGMFLSNRSYNLDFLSTL